MRRLLSGGLPMVIVQAIVVLAVPCNIQAGA
jgi:hypothetical protein